MGQCEVSFPAAAVRTGTNYLKTTTASSNKGNINPNMALKRGLIGSSSSSGAGGGGSVGGTGTGAGVGVFRSHHGPTAKHRTLNGNTSNFNLNTINTIEKSTLKGAASINNISNNNNNATLCSFAEGQQFTSRDLWLRMKSKGNQCLLACFFSTCFTCFLLLLVPILFLLLLVVFFLILLPLLITLFLYFTILGGRKNSFASLSEQCRLPPHVQNIHPYHSNAQTHTDSKYSAPNNPIKNVHRKNSFSNTSNDNLGGFGTALHGNNSNCSRRNPQPLILRRDCVTYSDGTNYSDSSYLPPSPYVLPPLHPSSSTSTSTSPSFTTAFSTSAFALTLLSSQTMGTVVLPDLVILTNEIPWSSVASEFSVLTAEDITFDYFGKYSRYFFYFYFS